MKIVISGLGLIGGSLALAIKKNLPPAEVWGYDQQEVLAEAERRALVNRTVKKWPDDCKGADVVFLCTPLSVIERHLQELNGVIDPETVVSDVGSTKLNLQKQVEEMSFSGIYAGGHPMTGAEKSGIGAANPLLFENSVYVITSRGENELVREKLLPVLEAIKARILLLDAEIHDQVMAVISHLPQLIAVGLMNLVAEKNGESKPYFELAAGGFRDLTRIASSSFGMWQDVFSNNWPHIEQVIGEFIGLLDRYRSEPKQLQEAFIQANRSRERVPRHSKGFLTPLTDVLVYVNDQVGVVAKISNALSAGGIDIRDIELLKIREKEGGVFRLSFSSREEAQQAIIILQSIHYQANIRE